MIKIIIKSNKTGRTVEGEYTAKELLDSYEDEIVEQLTECDCQPIGETNVVECNCCEEWEDYSLDIIENS